MKKMLLALSLIMGGCQASEHTNVFVTESGIEYKIRVEFVLPPKYQTQYPFISRAVQDAVNNWAEVVPINAVFLPFGRLGRRQINIRIASGASNPHLYGSYRFMSRTLYLNSTLLTTYAEAYYVALHEIGHVLGLQHIGESDDIGRQIATGMIIILNENAEEQLMYPSLTEKNRLAGISELDIHLVRLYLHRSLVW